MESLFLHEKIPVKRGASLHDLFFLSQSGRRLLINWVADLPQHRTYRSVYGASKVYTSLCRMTFFETKISNPLESLIG